MSQALSSTPNDDTKFQPVSVLTGSTVAALVGVGAVAAGWM